MYVAMCCSVLQYVALCCSMSQCAAVCCSALQCVAVCCSVLQSVAVCCNVLQCVSERGGVEIPMYQSLTINWHMLQHVAVRCSVFGVLQCVVVFYSERKCVECKFRYISL